MAGFFDLSGLTDPVIESPLAPARPNATGTGTGGQDVTAQFNAFLSGLQSKTQAFSDNMQTAANRLNTGLSNAAQSITVGSAFGAPLSVDSSVVYRIVAVVGGLILIAGAVWGFDNIRETATTAARRGAEIAAA